MDIEALKSFLAFVETGSFSRTATQMHKTQSAISMQMKKLQQDVGQTLFIKEGRNLHLTAEGIALAGYAKKIIQLQQSALTNLRSATPKKLLHLGCPDDYAESVLPVLIQLLHQHIEHLELHVTCASSPNLLSQLDRGLIDMAIITRSADSEQGYLLCQDKGVWVGAESTQLLEQANLPLAVFQKECRFHQAATEGLMKQNRAFHVIACSGSASTLRGLVKHDLAISAMANLSRNALPILLDPRLPLLPNIEIALVKHSGTNAAFSDTQLQQVCLQFQHQFQC
ncbi:LysR family transcriptional regulator [Pseudoalteromonas luteoviolacea]|uniref:LysR family transcriptional regulator n=1 Tax=Pseudoalteromonas luteoviolacea TaxID=43657 RepID=A0A0C1QC13_9GAMM|nr:LysR family transcriptional regulator [Pseudoalteromonas luteoviolacea]KID58141.1 LysR family transcriptional regulator [Pseudoalteromonas luteoviolacea]